MPVPNSRPLAQFADSTLRPPLINTLLVALPSAPSEGLGSHSIPVHHSCISVVSTLAKANQHHPLHRCVSSQEALCLPHRNLGGPLHRKAVGAGANGRKSDGADAMLFGKGKAASIAACEQFILALPAIAPDRANCVNDPLGRQPVALGDFRVAGRAAAQLPALLQDRKSTRLN